MRLTDEASNAHVLPAFLTEDGGLNSGFMIVQYTAAALCTENKVLSHPASVDTIPSSANVEDHVSMGMTAAIKLREVAKNLSTVLALELFVLYMIRDNLALNILMLLWPLQAVKTWQGGG